MSITRGPRPESNFYVLNKGISQDKRLSWGSRGLLIYLLGKPDNWQVSVEDLRNQTKDSAKPSGRDAVYGFISELIDAGYVVRTQGRAGAGGFSNNEYVVREAPLTDLPLTDSAYTANPTLTRTDLKQELIQTKLSPEVTAEGDKSEKLKIPFEKIMGIYNEILSDVFKRALSMDKKREANIRNCWNRKVDGHHIFRSADFWREYFAACRGNTFAQGANDRGWIAHLEYVTRESVVTGILEEMANAAA